VRLRRPRGVGTCRYAVWRHLYCVLKYAMAKAVSPWLAGALATRDVFDACHAFAMEVIDEYCGSLSVSRCFRNDL
jgi:hypothetical protein